MIPFLGDNFKKGIKAILSYIGTYSLWKQYSLRGQRQNKAFEDFNLYQILKSKGFKSLMKFSKYEDPTK